ncbi:YihA family ribosome biogenesis GTP-binding protein [Pseudoflavitalea sp. G-6-1-2]|uniref:ribosome biogenesis GTP-binding protein YihA/YsxC n=1 Tax=Pseudoflavitalea sp. G-6-1-2 TaxID=2728841 RepID=UPI00146EB881|nr:ribosome biogenesis GTP-binding protein YihA/YsxC [Pseudoflavitalea sp. G-6-1-2]NML20627.1 YihA family ribosome biogenesis GTP-binding protein [Pseudoflavitalea sp. G-6-1-2]
MLIKSANYLISCPDIKDCPKGDKPEYAFIGRSNVGKSSLINMLTNQSKLAKTSGTPGKTQLINFFDIESVSGSQETGAERNSRGQFIGEQKWSIVDLPGYGFAKVSQKQRNNWEQMIENYLRKRENLVNVFLLIDSRHGPQKIDLDFVNNLGKWEIPFALTFTKADKETQKEVSKNVKSFLDAMRKTWQFLPRHFVTSAEKKMGRDKILGFIEECNHAFANPEQ